MVQVIITIIFISAGITALFGGYGLVPCIALWSLIIAFCVLKEKTMDFYGIFLLAGIILACTGFYWTAGALFVLPTLWKD